MSVPLPDAALPHPPARAPQPPKFRWMALLGVLWVVAVVDVLLYAPSSAVSPERLVWYGLQLGIVPVAVMWCALGSEPWPIRVLASFASVALVCSTIERIPVAWLTGSLFVTVGFPLIVLRVFGWRLGWSDPPANQPPYRPQFTLRDICLGTLVASVLFAGLVRVRALETEATELCLYAASFSVAPCAILAAAFTRPWRISRWIIASVASIAAMVAADMVAGAGFLLFPIAAAQFAVVSSVCLAARYAGLRWVS